MATTTRFSGDRLRAARLRVGLTQAQLARAVQTSERNIQRWEAGTTPRLKYVVAIAAVTETRIEYLSGDGSEDGDDDGEADPVGTLADALADAIRKFVDSNEPAAHLAASTAGSSSHGG